MAQAYAPVLRTGLSGRVVLFGDELQGLQRSRHFILRRECFERRACSTDLERRTSCLGNVATGYRKQSSRVANDPLQPLDVGLMQHAGEGQRHTIEVVAETPT